MIVSCRSGNRREDHFTKELESSSQSEQGYDFHFKAHLSKSEALRFIYQPLLRKKKEDENSCRHCSKKSGKFAPLNLLCRPEAGAEKKQNAEMSAAGSVRLTFAAWRCGGLEKRLPEPKPNRITNDEDNN